MLTSAIFTKENHLVRKTIYEKQTNLLQTSNRVSRHIHTGIDIAQLSTERIPDVAELSRRLQETTGRCFVDAKNSYLSHDDRFDHLFNKEFPVTDYIRPLQDIQYTPLPDLFHEYF
jgi:phenylalanine-4-hydroxylase